MTKVLEVENISKRYKDFYLQNVSFALEKGTITGFIGENGAGKTTTLSAIMNLIKTDGGQILVNGKPVKNTREMKRISYLESNRDLYPEVLMKDYKFFVSKAYRKDWNEKKYRDYMNRFHMEDQKKIKELSTGMKAKFFLAVELAKQPDILLLDEPTSGLDPIARNELLEIIKSLAKEEQMTILFSSHITSDIEHIADKVIFIHGGQILLNMNKEDIYERFKKVQTTAYEKMSSQQKGAFGNSKIQNFDYYILNMDNKENTPKDHLENASLDDVLLYLTGGVRIA